MSKKRNPEKPAGKPKPNAKPTPKAKIKKTKNGSHMKEGCGEIIQLLEKFNLNNQSIDGLTAEHWSALGYIMTEFCKTTPVSQLLKEDKEYLEFLNHEAEINQILIVKGSVEYKFKPGHPIFEELAGVISEYVGRNITKANNQLIRETKELNGDHIHDTAQRVFQKLENALPSKRKRYLFIWELYRHGGYEFSIQQLHANDQAKAALIKNWIHPRAKHKFKI